MPESRSEPIPVSSTFARIALLVYGLLIVYASWYPFAGWHNSGLSPFDYLLAPLPHYWTKFDLITNILAYVPFGLLMVFGLYPRVRRTWAVLAATIAGILIAASMEAMQTYLPSRVPSNLDLMTNSAGIVIGALAGLTLTRTFLQESRFLMVRQQWFDRDAGRGLIVVSLWPLAQIYPQAYLFGHGQIVPILSDWLSIWLATPIDLGAIIRSGYDPTVEQFWLSEAIITACGLTGAVLALSSTLRLKAPKAALVLLLIASAFLVKSLTTALLFSPENAFAWLTPGAQGGILLGLVMLSGLFFARKTAQRHVAGLMLLMGLVVINIVPENPYFIATLQTWVQGKFLSFNGAAQSLSIVWPFIALWFLWRPVRRRKQVANPPE